MKPHNSKWKGGSPIIDNWKSAYAQIQWELTRHYERRIRFLDSMNKKLVCQECGGAGGEVVPVLDYGQGPLEVCGLCEGQGFVTPHERSMWLRWKKEQRQRKVSP